MNRPAAAAMIMQEAGSDGIILLTFTA